MSNVLRLAYTQPIPTTIGRSILMQQGGFGIYEGCVDSLMRQRLLSEATTLSGTATESSVAVSDEEQMRGGKPARRFLSGAGGQMQRALYHSTWFLGFLRRITHPALRPSGDIGTYSYYARPGDYLAIHRDILTCDVSVITCLSDSTGSAGTGGILCLYPNRIFEPLSSIRSTPSDGMIGLRLAIGQTIVLYGGIVPHALLPVESGQVRIVSVLCYHLP